jgi:hypothetical protein
MSGLTPNQRGRSARSPRWAGPSALVLLLLVSALGVQVGLGGVGAISASDSHARSADQLPPGDYYVNFTQTTLPPGTQWSVSLNGGSPQTGQGETISFAEPNNTYNYQVSSTGYSAAPSSGSVPVNGNNVSTPISFSPITYMLTISASGLNTGTNWWAIVGGTNMSALYPAELFFPLTEGSYPWSVASTGYKATPASGTVVVDGMNPTPISVTFSADKYTVTFTESGLPSGTEWSVTTNGTASPPPTTGTSTSVDLPDGYYSYTVSTTLKNWSAPGGDFVVNGAGVGVSFTFTFQSYTVTFFESGLHLPTLLWSVTLNGVMEESEPGSKDIYFYGIPNSTSHGYPFSVGAIPGWVPAPPSGTVYVNGSSPTQVIVWTQATYNVTFNESGLGSSPAKWSVTVTGTKNITTQGFGPLIPVTYNGLNGLPNGTYDYSIACADNLWEPANNKTGSFVIDGLPRVFYVTFIAVNESVTFTAYGLPAGMLWSANFTKGGPFMNTTGSTIVFELQNGTYSYHFWTENKSWAAPGGTFNITGGPVSRDANFTNLLYLISFNELNLAPGTPWSMTLGGALNSSVAPGQITFMEPNVTLIEYIVNPVPEYNLSNYGYGNITVHGPQAKPLNITFHPDAFPIRFNETGLPGGSEWWVNITYTNDTPYGPPHPFTGASGVVNLPNGNWSYWLASADKSYTPEVPSSGLPVNGAGFTVNVTFLSSTYAIKFQETGLPSPFLWTVYLYLPPVLLRNGTTIHPILPENSTTPTLIFNEPNGTYNFSVRLYGVYSPSPVSGNVSVHGANYSLSITFVKALYTITFSETGLPSGASWSVTLDGVTVQSTNSTIVFPVANGTYPYLVQSTGGSAASPASGSIHIAGSSTTMSISFGGSGGSGSGGLSGPQIAVLVGLVAAGAIVLGALLLSRRTRQSSAHPLDPSPPPSGTAQTAERDTPAETESVSIPGSVAQGTPPPDTR